MRMYITRECDYAMRVVRALADGTRLSVNEICEKESITGPFAYKILKKLQKARIVKGFRGVHGGYSLDCDLAELSLRDIYMAITPNMYIIECLQPGYQCVCSQQECGGCRVHETLGQIQEKLDELLGEQKMDRLIQKKES